MVFTRSFHLDLLKAYFRSPWLDFKFTGNFKFLFEFSWKDRQMQLTVRGGERWRINTFILSYSAKFRGLGVRALGAAPHFSLQTSVEHSWQFIPIHPGKLFILPVSTQLFILFSVSLSLSVSPSPLLLFLDSRVYLVSLNISITCYVLSLHEI